MKKEREILVEFLKAENMNTYRILAEFFARKFNDKEYAKIKNRKKKGHT